MLRIDAKYIQFLYLLSLTILISGLSTSMFLMSLGSIMLISVWLIEGNFASKFKILKTDRKAQFLILFFLIHIFGLLYTHNFEYGFKDIRVKLPLLIFPLVLSTTTIENKKWWNILLFTFILSVLVSTLYSYLVYKDIIHIERDMNDARTISRFISHIRLSMNICMVILLMFFYFTEYKTKSFWLIKLIITLWLLYFLYILESATGVMILFFCAFVGFIYYAILSKTALLRTLSVSALAIIVIATGLFFYMIITSYYQPRDLDISNLEEKTKYGEKYDHDIDNLQLENGHYIWLYIAPHELENTWNEKSEYFYEEVDKKGQPIKWTLIRYLTSKGLRKDRDGVNALNKTDIDNIENGIASVDANASSGLNKRIQVILYEFDIYMRGLTPNGNSVTQRFEYWRIGWNLFKENLFIGVGTGDINDDYRIQYRKDKSELVYKYRNRAHNQFLTILITFGIVGFIVFLLSLFIALFYNEIWKNILYVFFLTLIAVSFMGEDTLETQAGVTFYSFFNALLIFQIFSTKKTEIK